MINVSLHFFLFCGHSCYSTCTNCSFSFLVLFIIHGCLLLLFSSSSFFVIFLYRHFLYIVNFCIVNLFILIWITQNATHNTNFLWYLALQFSNQYEESLGKGTEPKGYKHSQNTSEEWIGRGQEYRHKNWKKGVSLSRQKTRKEKKSNKTIKKKKNKKNN